MQHQPRLQRLACAQVVQAGAVGVGQPAGRGPEPPGQTPPRGKASKTAYKAMKESPSRGPIELYGDVGFAPVSKLWLESCDMQRSGMDGKTRKGSPMKGKPAKPGHLSFSQTVDTQNAEQRVGGEVGVEITTNDLVAPWYGTLCVLCLLLLTRMLQSHPSVCFNRRVGMALDSN